jgi:competence protein ComEC
LNDVVSNFSVRSALVARTPSSDPEFVKFSETLLQRTTPLNLIGAGDVLQFGDVKVLVVWPQANDSQNAPSRNNDSVVLQLNYGKRAVLMTGDIEKEAESAILRFNSRLKNDVVKVPHHGSKTSSTESFVWSAQPCVAVISVGLQSRFGHPRPEVVARWKSAGAEVMTTGRKGTITVTTNGNDLQIETYLR